MMVMRTILMMLSDDDTVDASLSLSICSKSFPLKGCILTKSARWVVSTKRLTDNRSTTFWKREKVPVWEASTVSSSATRWWWISDDIYLIMIEWCNQFSEIDSIQSKAKLLLERSIHMLSCDPVRSACSWAIATSATAWSCGQHTAVTASGRNGRRTSAATGLCPSESSSSSLHHSTNS